MTYFGRFGRAPQRLFAAAAFAMLVMLGGVARSQLTAQCGPNPITCENQLTGNPASEWDVSGSGDATIQGFATDMSVNKGGIVQFKVKSAAVFTMNIYRLGYYNGLGARKVATIANIAAPAQPACLSVAATGLLDCGNWTINTSWAVPANAVSGIYVAKIIRNDTSGASHIVFVVRDDASTADILFQTSDTTWQAYNQYGGRSTYLGSPDRAFKVSYNRPFATRSQSAGYGKSNYVFYAEYPMVRWLERNGYSVSYFSGIDTDRRGADLLQHKVFLTIGHDEYWSGQQRTNVEAARAAGVHLALLSGNDMFWKTRLEPSIDGTNTANRTLVVYKETKNDVVDPTAAWTGTWRDPRSSPPKDGGRPENALSGQLFTVNRGSAALKVPYAFSKLRFWRNTAVAQMSPGQTATLGAETIGYEWDEDVDNGFRPAGLMQLSSTTVDVPEHLVDFGNTYVPGTATHSMTMYRHPSGAIVFGAGTVQWVWGLETNHDTDTDIGPGVPDPDMTQAMVNVLADMTAMPSTPQPGVIVTTASTDTTAPLPVITSPASGATLTAQVPATISGTASDSGGVVGIVEVSTDGGATWRRATGTQAWTFSWVPSVVGPINLLARASDDSGNIRQSAATSVTVTPPNCPCSIWSNTDVPWLADSLDAQPIEIGVKWRSTVNGLVNGVRFYKSAANGGTHTGHLWTAAGQLLASVTFAGETASGWQQATFASPVPVQAGTTYVVSYFAPQGHYSNDDFYFGRTGVDRDPLRALADGVDGANGLFLYSAISAFPNQTFDATNYWVDVRFTPETTPPDVALTAPAAGTTVGGNSVVVSATATDPIGVAGVQFKMDGVNIGAEDTVAPYSVTWNTTVVTNASHTLTAVARDSAGNAGPSAPVTVTVFNVDVTPPAVSISAPLNGATISGSVTVSAAASDPSGIAGVQFLLDGVALGAEITAAPFSMVWDTTTASNVAHTLTARARDGASNQAVSAAVNVVIANPVPGAPAIDVVAWGDQPSAIATVTTSAFSTATTNQLLLALVGTDDPNGGILVSSVSGGSLTWVLVGRANVQKGTSEIWRAFAPARLTNVTVTATLNQPVSSALTVISFSNVDTTGTNGSGAIGAIASASAATGATTATLTTTRDKSWVIGVGNDFDNAVARTVPAGQVLLHQYLAPIGDTYWMQRLLNPIAQIGSVVALNDTAPTGDRWNFIICEVRASSAPDTTAPSVSITAPAGGATITGTSTIAATASDNVGVTGVQFLLDGVNLGAEVTNAPYQFAWNSTTASNGSHAVTAIARDGAGNTTTAAAVTVTVNNDTTAPAVSITSPAAAATVSGNVTITASATDAVGVVGVQFKLDGANFGAEVTAAPYQVAWNTALVANGSHTITAVARDAAANTATAAAVTVTVNNADATPPTVAMTAPAGGATVAGAVTVSATAGDNIAVVGVQFKLDGVNLGAEDTAAPYTIAWSTTTTPNGSHTLTAVARDGAGNTTTSASVTVTVNNDTAAPAVSITAPAPAATVSGSVTITAAASDNVAVAGVQFKVDGVNLGAEVTAAPYQVGWITTSTANGSHAITAVARDAAGNTATAAAVTVTVNNVVQSAPVIDAVASGDQPSAVATVTTSAFSTTTPNQLLLALIAADDPNTGISVSSVSGASLTWVLVGRANVQRGTSEIWRAFAPAALTNVTVTASLNQAVSSAITVVTFSNVDTSGTNGSGAIGAIASANAPSGAPTVTLTTTRDRSWVLGVGNDFDNPTARTVPAGQVMLHQYLPPIGDTYWMQRIANPVALSGTATTINDTAPTADRWNYIICEVRANSAPDITAPTVAISAPAEGATVSGSATVTATASDDIGVAGVQFKLDGVNLGVEDTAAPYSAAWSTATAANGAHSLTAVARDAAGNTTTSAAVGVTVNNDTTAPVISITAPAAGASVSGSVVVSAGASDNVAVAGVQFRLDGVNLGAEVTAAPYQVAWNTTLVANGSHTLTAVARDAAGNSTSATAITVTVNNVDGTAPTVAIVSPVNGATVSGAVTISASASDNVAVVGVQFKLDGANLGLEVTGAPYTISWSSSSAANGSHSITAVARDGAGNTTTAAAVTVTVNNDLVAPAVSITAPADGATVSGAAVSVTATATDAVGVAGVQFLLDGVSLGAEVTAAPYSVVWNTALAANGSHTLAARARDAAGNQTTSTAVTVTVSNIATGPPVIDTTVWFDQETAKTTVATGAFSTTAPNELLLAFIATDYLTGTNVTVQGVTGGGLTWVLVQRTNVQRGTSEIWRAFAPSTLSGVTVTATLSQAVTSSMTVVTFSNVDTTGTNGSGAIGATTSANRATGAPTATLVTTRNNSLVFGVGNDYDRAVARTVGAGQVMVHQVLSVVGDTYWVQRVTNPVPASGTTVTVNDTAPTADRSNLTICEIRGPQ